MKRIAAPTNLASRVRGKNPKGKAKKPPRKLKTTRDQWLNHIENLNEGEEPNTSLLPYFDPFEEHMCIFRMEVHAFTRKPGCKYVDRVSLSGSLVSETNCVYCGKKKKPYLDMNIKDTYKNLNHILIIPPRPEPLTVKTTVEEIPSASRLEMTDEMCRRAGRTIVSWIMNVLHRRKIGCVLKLLTQAFEKEECWVGVPKQKPIKGILCSARLKGLAIQCLVKSERGAMKWYSQRFVVFSRSIFKPHFVGPLEKVGNKKFVRALLEKICYYQSFYEDELPGGLDSAPQREVTFVRDGKTVTMLEKDMTRYDRHCMYTVSTKPDWKKGCFISQDRLQEPYLTIQRT